MSNNRFVVTIQRQFGSLGRPIAQKMSAKLGVEFYDRDIVEQAAKKLNLPYSVVDENEEKAQLGYSTDFFRMINPFGSKTSGTQDKIFEAQKNIISFLAEKGSCIIVGRCSDFILHDLPNSMHIFIYAPYERRVENCINDLKIEPSEVRKMINEVDKNRDDYHLHYAGYKPDDKDHKDILIDSSLLGTEGTADFLVELIKRRFRI